MLNLVPPLDADRFKVTVGDVDVVHIGEPFTDGEFQIIAKTLEAHPQVVLRINTSDENMCTLSFLRFFPNLRRISIAYLYNAQSAEPLNQLSDNLDYLDLGLTQKPLDLRPLKFRRLKTLTVGRHERGLSGLIANNSQLTDLLLRNHKADVIFEAIKSSSVENLTLVGGSLKDAAWLKKLPSLKSLNLVMVRGVDDPMLTNIVETTRLEWLTLDTLSGITRIPDLSNQQRLKRVDLNTLTKMRDPDALGGLSQAPHLSEVSVTSSKLQPVAFQPLVNHPTLAAITAGLGNVKKNQEAEAITGLPWAASANEYATRMRGN